MHPHHEDEKIPDSFHRCRSLPCMSSELDDFLFELNNSLNQPDTGYFESIIRLATQNP
jgi:hypothetical protein